MIARQPDDARNHHRPRCQRCSGSICTQQPRIASRKHGARLAAARAAAVAASVPRAVHRAVPLFSLTCRLKA